MKYVTASVILVAQYGVAPALSHSMSILAMCPVFAKASFEALARITVLAASRPHPIISTFV